MTPFYIRKEDLDMLKRKIDRYLADWSNEQDRNSDLNIGLFANFGAHSAKA